jgi:hypothetical protein
LSGSTLSQSSILANRNTSNRCLNQKIKHTTEWVYVHAFNAISGADFGFSVFGSGARRW